MDALVNEGPGPDAPKQLLRDRQMVETAEIKRRHDLTDLHFIPGREFPPHC